MPHHPLTNFEIQAYYQNEPRFIGIYSRDKLSNKIKDGAYVINLDEYSDIGTHWIAFSLYSDIGYSLDRSNKFIRTGDTNYIYKYELDKACFAYDAAYSVLKT